MPCGFRAAPLAECSAAAKPGTASANDPAVVFLIGPAELPQGLSTTRMVRSHSAATEHFSKPDSLIVGPPRVLRRLRPSKISGAPAILFRVRLENISSNMPATIATSEL